MGLTYANIELRNADDLAYVRKGIMGADEVRQMTIRTLVDTGSIMLCINETIKDVLGLPFFSMRRSQLANGLTLDLEVVGPVIVRYLGRDCSTNAIVLPDDQEPLLGAIPMEEMDLYVHPSRNELLPMHADGLLLSLK
jgi:clan AA aspartic protease